MGYFYKRAVSIARDYVFSNYEEVEVFPGKCRYNYRCHNNAVHDAIDSDQESIAMVVYLDEQHPIIHFVNIDSEGKYRDNTLGHWSSQYRYFFVRKINRGQFFEVVSIFTKYRDYLRMKIPFWIRIFSGEVEF